MEKMKWLCNVRNEMEAGMVAGILENAGIPHRVFTRGAGAIYSMSTIFGAEIQVAADAHAQAEELLEAFFKGNADVVIEETPEETRA